MKLKWFTILALVILLTFTTSHISAIAIILPKIKKTTNPDSFVGKWEMKTIVTQSSCPDIIVGSTTESELVIEKNRGGKDNLFAYWNGGAWTESSSILSPLSKNEALTKRATELNFDPSNSWKAVLIDHLTLEEEDKMHSESIVKQYKNDILIGEYKTFSILTKIE